MDPRARLLTALALAAALLAAGCGGDRPPLPFSASWPTMGTVASLQVHDVDRELAEKAMDAVRAAYDSVVVAMDTWDPDSEISRLNRAPADSAVALSTLLDACLSAADSLKMLSGGAFDPSAGPLMDLWGFTRRQGRLPAPAEVDSARALMGGYRRDRGAVVKTLAGAGLDLGGVAKGFAVDRAAADLRALGVNSALIDLGGNIFGLGAPPGRSAWRLGVRDPRNTDDYLAVFTLRDAAVATSGAYERFVTIDGRRYGHVMNPATGRPAEGLLGATVIHPSAAVADGLSTALFVLGPDAALALLARVPGAQAVLVLPPEPGTNQARVVATPGLRGNLELRPEAAVLYSLEFAAAPGGAPSP